MKRPNGYGTVKKIDNKGNRRNPYAVLITTGWTDEGKPIQRPLGYAKTERAGEAMLSQYHENPYNLDLVNISFKFLYKQWYQYKKDLGMKPKTLNLYNRYYKHYERIENKSFEKITRTDLQEIVDDVIGTKDYKGKIINVYSQMYNYAKAMNMRLKNNASKLVILDKGDGKTTESTPRTPFNDEEIKILWNNRNEIVDEILVDIYTGVRPGELLVISEVHDDYFITGLKTEAGKDRAVPLNHKIKDIFHNLIDNKRFDRYKSQDNLYHTWKDQLEKLGLGNHVPYECRHTFATLMDRAGANSHIVKLIMGHKIKDLTKRVYTHKLIEELIAEVNKI